MKFKHDFRPDDALPGPGSDLVDGDLADGDGSTQRRGCPPEALAIGAIVLALWVFALVRVFADSLAS